MPKIFLHNWQQKLATLLAAVILWVFVNHSIIETKTIPNVPIRIVNMPTDKTIPGILPNGFLGRRVTLTLSGSKDVVDELEPGDLEVVLDAAAIDSNEWIVQITKKNLVSLNPSIDLQRHINYVGHADFILKMSPLTTSNIPIFIRPPIGEAPPGYEFLDIWPTELTQTLSGPKEEIQLLQVRGLKLQFDLNDISKGQLDAIKTSGKHDDEISFPVPSKWKMVAIPFHQFAKEEINDPSAKNLRIDFLKKQMIPVGKPIPVEVFYPTKYSSTLNPDTYRLSVKAPLIEKEGIVMLDLPVYVHNVSSLFLDIVKDNLHIVITAAPPNEREVLQWSLNLVGAQELEDTYVAYLLASQSSDKGAPSVAPPPLGGEGTLIGGTPMSKERESVLRKRFREYLQKLALYTGKNERLKLRPLLTNGTIVVKLPGDGTP